MPIDYSKISTEDLEALQNSQYDKVSTVTLEYLQGGNEPASPVEKQVTSPQGQEEGGFFSNVGSDLKKRFNTVTDPGFLREGFNPISTLENTVRLGGQVAGVANDVIGNTLKSVYKTLMSQDDQDAISSGMDSITKNPTVANTMRDIGVAYDQFALENPNLSKDIEGAANIAGFIPMGKGAQLGLRGAKGAAKETGAIVNDVNNLFQRVVAPVTEDAVDTEIKQVVKNNLNKSIKATAKGKSTLPLIEKYFDDAGTGIKEIINNRQGLNLTNDVGEVVPGALPQTRLQMAEAIHNTEKKLFNEYDAMQKAAGKKGAVLDLEPIAKQYDDVINNETLRSTKEGRAVIAHAEEAQAILREVKTMTPQAAQDFIAQANNKLLNKNLLPVDVSKASADVGIASIMRKELDNLIESTEGAGYQEIKKRYGAVKSLRDGTNKAAFASFAEKGSPNFFDITSGTALVHGLLSMNPATIAGSSFMEALNILRRQLRNPDTYVKKMFSNVDNLMTKKSGFIPESKTGKYIQGKFTSSEKPTKYPFSDKSGTIATPLPLPMPERGFTLKGQPYGETLRPIRRSSDIIDAEFTSYTRKALDTPQGEPILSLPGQGFMVDDIVPRVSNARLKSMYENLDEDNYLKGLRNAKRRF